MSVSLVVTLVSTLVSTLTIRPGNQRRDLCTRRRAFVGFQTASERALRPGFGRRKTRLCIRSTRVNRRVDQEPRRVKEHNRGEPHHPREAYLRNET